MRHHQPGAVLALAVAVGVAGAVLVAAPRTVRAQATMSDEDKAKAAEANRHFLLGVDLYNEQKYLEALIEFQRAYETYPHPSVLYNIAVTYRDLSEYDLAIEYYQRFLTEAPGKVKQERLDQAKAELDAMRARVGTIAIYATPDGSIVTVDGKEIGMTPLGRPVVRGPGNHVVEVRGPDGRTETRTVSLASGDAARVDVDVNAISKPGGGGGVGDGGSGAIRVFVPPRARAGRLALTAALATNAMAPGDTGAPALGATVRFGNRITAGVDVVLVAFAVIPSVRVRLAGSAVAVYGVLAAPVNLTDGGESSVFVAGAAGAGVRWEASRRVAVRAEALFAVAGGDHGSTLPAFVGVELWF